MDITPATAKTALTPEQIVKAWRNPTAAKQLSAEAKAQLPANPAGFNDESVALLNATNLVDPDRRTHGGQCYTNNCFSSTCASLLCKTSRYHCQ